MNRLHILCLCSSIGLSACAGDPKYLEEDFGNSVRQMVAAQIYDPAAASNPDGEPPLIVDGVVIDNGVQSYRKRSEHEEQDNNVFTFTLD